MSSLLRGAVLITAMLLLPSLAPDRMPLAHLATELATLGRIDDPAATARVLWDAIGVPLRHAPDYFGRSDVAAGEIRYEIDERSPLARRGLEAGLVVGGGDPSPFGRIQAQLDVADWSLVSPMPWDKAAAWLRQTYPVIGDVAAKGTIKVELPAQPGRRLVLTVASHGGGRIWYVHVSQYGD